MNEHHAIQSAANTIPADIYCAADYEFAAKNFIDAPTYAYIAGGSAQDLTLAANRAAFFRYSLLPRLLCDVSAGHTRTALLGREFAHPILLAPVAYQALAHPGGEIETARAAAATDSCMIASTLSSRTLEDIAAAAAPDRWFQLYFQPQRDATLALLRRAEAAGFGAIVVTLDASIQLPSLRARRAGFQLPAGCVAANLQDQPAPQQNALRPGESRIFQGAMRSAPTWRDLDWLQTQTTLPILVKGVLHPDDALALQARGIAGLVVSNHGGRALDGAPATLAALPAIRAAVGSDYPLLLDGGIRSGSDVFTALALGANAVLAGRLPLYALSVAGALGVAHLLKLLREELEVCMALAGCATLNDIRASCVQPNAHPAASHPAERDHRC